MERALVYCKPRYQDARVRVSKIERNFLLAIFPAKNIKVLGRLPHKMQQRRKKTQKKFRNQIRLHTHKRKHWGIHSVYPDKLVYIRTRVYLNEDAIKCKRVEES